MSKIKEFLEALGQGTGRELRGGSAVCVCPDCKYESKHLSGMPCNTLICPKCGATMVGDAIGCN